MADNAVTNPDFSQVDARDATAPADWRLPDEGYWSRAEVGPTGKPCLAYDAEQAASGPVTQKVQFLEPGVTWELRAKLKAGGGLMPVIVITDVGEDRELGRATAQPGGVWQTVGLRFVPVMADVIVEIYADGKHPSGGQAGAGKVWVAQVELAKIGDADGQAGMPDLGENIALGASYTMTMQGRYSLCADADDNVQLTDGVYTEGYFWTQPSTVGWRASRPAHVTIDLGEAQPIRGMSFGSAAGVAGVTWPASLVIYVSDDGESWYDVADLVALNTSTTRCRPSGSTAPSACGPTSFAPTGASCMWRLSPAGHTCSATRSKSSAARTRGWLRPAQASRSPTRASTCPTASPPAGSGNTWSRCSRWCGARSPIRRGPRARACRRRPASWSGRSRRCLWYRWPTSGPCCP